MASEEYSVLIPVSNARGVWKMMTLALVFKSGRPYALLGEGIEPKNAGPEVHVPLDPSQLLVLRNGRATHIYRSRIVDPRKPH